MEHPHGNCQRVELVGEYGSAQREELAALFSGIGPDSDVVIDLTNVTYVDSTFLNELLKLSARLNRQPITLAGANSSLQRLLTIVHFEQLCKWSNECLLNFDNGLSNGEVLGVAVYPRSKE